MRPAQDDVRRGALFMIAAALSFAVMGVGVKVAGQTLPNAMVVFFRSAFGLVALLPWLGGLGPGGLRTHHLREHLVRGLAGLGAMYCFFYAIAHLKLAEAMLLNYSLPLFMPVVERLWLREPFPPGLWGALALGFGGIVLILKPGVGLFQPAAVVGLAAAVFAAVAQVGVRRLTWTEPIRRIVFYFAVVSTVVSAAPLGAAWQTPGAREWAALALAGGSATLGQLLLTRAYAYAAAARVGPFIYVSVVFAGAFDWALWGALPDVLSVVGVALVGAAGMAALRGRAAGPPA